jgi:hypothetical protein
VCGCGRSHTRSAACQELAKTGTNRMDRATQAGHADFADLDVRDAVEHWFTLSCSLGVKWSQVQILSARPQKGRVSSTYAIRVDRTNVRPEQNCHRLSREIVGYHRTHVRSVQSRVGGRRSKAACRQFQRLGLGVNVGAESKRYVGVAEPGCDVRDGHARPAGA